uniref:Uncharacterized protein n=1 Tax=Glossina austeni TaxID=7395 RepID=A0A1A9VD51_GLOAU
MRNKREDLQRRLWEHLEKEEQDPSLFEFYGNSDVVYPTGSIEEKDRCTIGERREARTYVKVMYQQIEGEINALFDTNVEVLEEKVGGTLGQFATLRCEVGALKATTTCC